MILVVAGVITASEPSWIATRDHKVAEQSKNYRYTTNHQVVIDADTRLVVVVGRPLRGNRNDCRAWAESDAKAPVGSMITIADGGYPGTGLVMPHRRRKGEERPGPGPNTLPPAQRSFTGHPLDRGLHEGIMEVTCLGRLRVAGSQSLVEFGTHHLE